MDTSATVTEPRPLFVRENIVSPRHKEREEHA